VSIQELRILRDRLASFEDDLDREADRPESFASARLLARVYDGGAMPSVPERVYFTHPVTVTGSEVEGGTGTLTTDTSVTVPVIVLGGVPAVDDYLTAYAVGGRWVSERGGSGGGGEACPDCTIDFCFLDCNGRPLDGFSVTITYPGSPTLCGGESETFTTSSGGCVAPDCFPPCGTPVTYGITVSAQHGYAAYSGSFTITCPAGATETISLSLADGFACNPCCGSLSGTFAPMVTDANGTWPLTFDPCAGCYTGCAGVTLGIVMTGADGCVSRGTHTANYSYTLCCNPTTGDWTLTRTWPYGEAGDGSGLAYVQGCFKIDGDCIGLGNPCAVRGLVGGFSEGTFPGESFCAGTAASVPLPTTGIVGAPGAPDLPDPVGDAPVVSF
jgi:hypothetical protein